MTQIITINPATAETIETYDLMDKQTALQKVEEAHEAFLSWREKSYKERAYYLHDIAKVLRDNADDLAALMTQ